MYEASSEHANLVMDVHKEINMKLQIANSQHSINV